VQNRNNGERFEELFAQYMETVLGVTATERRAKLKGKAAATPYECDVHGVIRSKVWRILQIGGLATMAAAAWALFNPGDLPNVEHVGRSIETAVGSTTAGLGLLILGCSGILFGGWGRTRHTRHIWVECKDRRATIKRADISKLERSAADVRANAGANWRPVELWFASTSAYDQDALAIAREYGVRCFQLIGDEIVEC